MFRSRSITLVALLATIMFLIAACNDQTKTGPGPSEPTGDTTEHSGDTESPPVDIIDDDIDGHTDLPLCQSGSHYKSEEGQCVPDPPPVCTDTSPFPNNSTILCGWMECDYWWNQEECKGYCGDQPFGTASSVLEHCESPNA